MIASSDGMYLYFYFVFVFLVSVKGRFFCARYRFGYRNVIRRATPIKSVNAPRADNRNRPQTSSVHPLSVVESPNNTALNLQGKYCPTKCRQSLPSFQRRLYNAVTMITRNLSFSHFSASPPTFLFKNPLSFTLNVSFYFPSSHISLILCRFPTTFDHNLSQSSSPFSVLQNVDLVTN